MNGWDPQRFTVVSPEVVQALGEVATVGAAELAALVAQLPATRWGRARINVHRAPHAPVQEMVIAMTRDSYVRPHAHRDKGESFLMLAGRMRVVLLDDAGAITRIIPLAADGPLRYYSLAAPTWHCLLQDSAPVVFLEVTRGPFTGDGSHFPPWAPPQEDPAAAAYQTALRQRADALMPPAAPCSGTATDATMQTVQSAANPLKHQ